MAATTSTRRTLLGAMAFAPVAIVAPVVHAATPPRSACTAALDAADEGRRQFCALPVDLEHDDLTAFKREEAKFLATQTAADHSMPTNWQEFARLFDHVMDQGNSIPHEDIIVRLYEHAKRLAV